MAGNSPEERIALTRAAWEAYDAGDIDAVLRVLDADVVVHVPVELANTGTYRGHDEFVRWLAVWSDAWESYEMRIIDTVPVGERHVVSRMRQTGIGRGSGIEVTGELGWLFEVRDGLATHIELFGDFDAALAAAREREGPGADAGA
jgi:ketosteroid isomerase-like protein